MRFIYEPKGSKTVMHIERHNALGDSLWKPLCGRELTGQLRSSNLTFSRPLCQGCLDIADEMVEEP